MDKKVDIICKHPLGIIPCTSDPDIYNVFSFSSDQRIVDMLFFECSCPRKDRSICSHIRAITNKFQNRYSRELFNIYKVINETNVKNSLSCCVDKAENHQILLLRSISRYFHLSDIIDEPGTNTSGLGQKYKKVIVSILKVLSSISWRHYLIKTKNQPFLDSVKNIQLARSNISIEKLVESVNLSFSEVIKKNHLSPTEFLSDLERLSLEKADLKRQISIVDLVERLIKGNELATQYKDIIIKNMASILNKNDIGIGLSIYKHGTKTKQNEEIYFSRFLQRVAKVLRRYQTTGDIDIYYSMNVILYDIFGISLDFIGIENRVKLDRLLASKNTDSFNPMIVDAITLLLNDKKPNYEDSVYNKYETSNFSIRELVHIIRSAPILVNLYDYLLWFSTGKNDVFGDLGDLIEENMELESFHEFFLFRFSHSNRVFDLYKTESLLYNNKVCICKILKPNNCKNITTYNYYLNMVDSIINCNGKNTVNYFIGGCIQENSLNGFISSFSEEQLLSDINENKKLVSGFDEFLISVLNFCPPLFMVDIWKYVIYPLKDIVLMKEEKVELLLFQLFEKSAWVPFNNLLQVAPSCVTKGIEEKIYKIDALINFETKRNSFENIENCSINFQQIIDNTSNVTVNICQKCSSKEIVDNSNKELFIASIQQKRFGFSTVNYDIVKNFSSIIEQSCRSLSLNLYSKLEHYIYELIQNADDNEYCDCIGRLPSVIFIYFSSGLLLLNNEIGFGESDIESICNIGCSSKKSYRKIGRFGIGFKSVFSITNTPYIFSNGFSIKFNSESINGAYIFPEWISDEINTIIPLHTLQTNFEFELSNYQTKIWLPFKKSCEAGKTEIEDELLLFTNNIKQLKIIKKDSIVIITKNEYNVSNDLQFIKIKRRICSIDSFLNEKKRKSSRVENETERKFIIVKFDIEKHCERKPKILFEMNRSPIISIGIELSGNNDSFDGACVVSNAMVYSFLPIKECGFKFLINADFELTTSRESLSLDSKWNMFLKDNITNAIIFSIKFWCDLEGFSLLKRTFINILPSKNDQIDPFFSPIVQDIIKGLYFRCYVYTSNHEFTYPRSSVFIDKTKPSHKYITRLFPNIDEFSYFLNKYCHKQLIYNFLVDTRQKFILQDLGIQEFNIGMLIDILCGLVRDFSYFGRSYNWYFDLFLLLEDYFISSDDSDRYKCRLQYLPLLITEDDKYIEFLKPETNKKQLFLAKNELPSIPKLDIHFVKNKFLDGLREYLGNELLYNKVISLINLIGPNYIDSSEYVNIVTGRLSKINLNPDELIYYTSIIARLTSSIRDIHLKEISVVNSKNEVLPISKSFVLFNNDIKPNIVDSILELFAFDSEISSGDFFFNTLSPQYIKHGSKTMWNTFFSHFGLTEIPFYFEELIINSNNISEVYDIYKKYCFFDYSKLNNHIKNVERIVKLNGEVCDYLCMGLDVLFQLIEKLVFKHNNNAELRNLLLKFNCNLYNLLQKYWERIKCFWKLKARNVDNRSFVSIQFTNYPLFVSVSIFQEKFIYQGLSSSRRLTMFQTSKINDNISKVVNFLYVDQEDNVDPDIIREALEVHVDINIDYLVLLINSIKNKNNIDIDLIHKDDIDIDDYIHIVDEVVYLYRRNNLKKNIFDNSDTIFPFIINNNIVWKSLDDMFWEDDEGIIPEELSLSYKFDNIYGLNSSLCDLFDFFVIQHGVSPKPIDKHIVLWLSDLFNTSSPVPFSSHVLYVYSKIISKLINLKFDKIKHILHIPVFTENSNEFKWVRYEQIKQSENEFLFSDSPYFYYFFLYKQFTGRNVIWSPYFSLFLSLGSISKNNTYCFDSWNSLFSKSVMINIDKINILSDDINTIFYSNLISGFIGPLFEESIKNQVSIPRKNWKELTKGKIHIVDSDINIKFLSNSIVSQSFFDKSTGLLYLIHPSKIRSDQEKSNFVLSSLLFVDSYFEKENINTKCLNVSDNVFRLINNFYELEQADIVRVLTEFINRIEYEFNDYKIDMNYILFPGYNTNERKILKTIEYNNISRFETNKVGIKSILMEIGRKGEELAYQYLLNRYAIQVKQGQLSISWVNKIEETGLPYDLLMVLTDPENESDCNIYVEVKSSSNRNKNSFHITIKEWEFAKHHGNYWILLVSGIELNTFNDSVVYKIIQNPYGKWKAGGLHMMLSTNNELK